MHAPMPRILAGLCALWLAVSTASSCRHAPRRSVPRARPVQDGTVSLVVTRLAQAPEYTYSRERSVGVLVSVDPSLVELDRVETLKLWALDGETSSWAEVGSGAPGAGPIVFVAPGEGEHGLRASVTYRNGDQALVPAAGDAPQLWFCVDETPPRIVWTRASTDQRMGELPRVELGWEVEERQFGREPLVLEYSIDGGETWRLLTKRDAEPGPGRYRWRPGASVRDEVLLRLRASDLAGHSGSDLLALRRRKDGSFSPADPLAIAPRETPEDVDGDAAPASVSGAAAELAGGTAAGADEGTDARAGAELVPAPDGDAGAPAREDEHMPFAFLPFEAACLPAGSEVAVRWTLREDAIEPEWRERPVTLEYTAESGWKPAGEAPLGAGTIAWRTPEATLAGVRLRLLLPLSDGRVLVRESVELAIDASPPVVRCPKVPAIAGPRLALPIEVEDAGCAGPSSVEAFLRRRDEEFWTPLSRDKAVLDEGAASVLRLDLSDLPESEYDVYLRAGDRLGNVSAVPAVGSRPLGSFLLDRSPPRVALEPPVLDWVSSFEGALEVHCDAADCVPPLVVEAREPGRDWRQVLQYDALGALDEPLRFELPAGVAELEVRVTVRDAAGNEGSAAVGPRAVEKPIRLEGLVRVEPFIAYSKETISWALHPRAAEHGESLRIEIAYREEPAGEWITLHDGTGSGAGRFDWILPEFAGGICRVRARLYRGDEVIGEDLSPPLAVESFLQGISGAGELAAGLKEARERELAFRSRREELVRAGATAPSEELDLLAAEAQAAYERVLELDSSHPDASFELAVLLGDVDARAHSGSIVDLLDRTLEAQPNHVPALINRSGILIQAGDFERAKALLDRVLAIEDSGLARYNLGLTLLFLERPREARREFGLALDSGAPVATGDAWFYTAYCHLLEGDSQKALAVYREKEALIPAELRSVLDKELR